jgi:hypothetical protein
MGSLGGKSDYESVRDARISENLVSILLLDHQLSGFLSG